MFVVYRWILAAYFGGSFGYSISDTCKHGHQQTFWIYLSHLNLFATAVTMFVGACLVTLDFWSDSQAIPKWIIFFYRTLWSQSVMLSLIVSTFYWVVIYRNEKIDLNNFVNHIGNSAVPLIDVFIVSHPPNFWNFVFSLPAVFAYTIFTFVFQAMGGLNK